MPFLAQYDSGEALMGKDEAAGGDIAKGEDKERKGVGDVCANTQ